MSAKELPSPELLRQLLRYEPETGKLYWRERNADMSKEFNDTECNRWNGAWAGKEAFTSTSCGYKQGHIMSSHCRAHRVIWAIVYGEWPKHIDHINGIKDDNRIENLRSVSHAENCRNQKRASNNTSGVCGVYWCKRYGKWRVQIGANGKCKHLGYFDDFDKAVATRKSAEAKYDFHQNHGNR